MKAIPPYRVGRPFRHAWSVIHDNGIVKTFVYPTNWVAGKPYGPEQAARVMARRMNEAWKGRR